MNPEISYRAFYTMSNRLVSEPVAGRTEIEALENAKKKRPDALKVFVREDHPIKACFPTHQDRLPHRIETEIQSE